MAEFNPSATYMVGDRVSHNDLYYECIVNNPDTTSTPDLGKFWNEAFIKLSDVVTRAYVSGPTTSRQMENTTKEYKIQGFYFDSSTEVVIDDCVVNITNITPTEITMDVTVTNILGLKNVYVTKAGVANDGINVTYEVVDEITGSGSAGTFDTNFSNDVGASLWPDWNLAIFGNVNSIDSYFVSSDAGTPSGSTGASSAVDSYYAFCEASNPNNGDGQYGTATTSNFRAIQSIDFDYHMYGSGMGDLTVQGYDGTSWSDLYVLAGQQQSAQGDAWLHASIACSDLEEIRFCFNYNTFSTAYTADICIDNISIVST